MSENEDERARAGGRGTVQWCAGESEHKHKDETVSFRLREGSRESLGER